jgi:hypothetical protein
LVNEIGLDGKVIHLTDDKAPKFKAKEQNVCRFLLLTCHVCRDLIH